MLPPKQRWTAHFFLHCQELTLSPPTHVCYIGAIIKWCYMPELFKKEKLDLAPRYYL